MARTRGTGRTASSEHTISASVRLGQASVTGARQLGQCGGMTTAARMHENVWRWPIISPHNLISIASPLFQDRITCVSVRWQHFYEKKKRKPTPHTTHNIMYSYIMYRTFNYTNCSGRRTGLRFMYSRLLSSQTFRLLGKDVCCRRLNCEKTGPFALAPAAPFVEDNAVAEEELKPPAGQTTSGWVCVLLPAPEDSSVGWAKRGNASVQNGPARAWRLGKPVSKPGMPPTFGDSSCARWQHTRVRAPSYTAHSEGRRVWHT